MAVVLPLDAEPPSERFLGVAPPLVLRPVALADRALLLVPALVRVDFAFPLPEPARAFVACVFDFDPARAVVAFVLDFVPALPALLFEAPEALLLAFPLLLPAAEEMPALLRPVAEVPLLLAAAPWLLLPLTAFGRARLLGALVAVAIFFSFICDDFTMPVLLPNDEPDRAAVLVLDASARPLLPSRLARPDVSVASLALAADFTLPPPVITPDGLFFPPRALAVLFTGFVPGVAITASVFVLRVVAPFCLLAAFVPAIGLTS